jgi:hypothetical protein
MAKIVVLVQADLPDADLQSLVDAGHEVTILHPQKSSVFALLKGLGGSLSAEKEPKEENPEDGEAPEGEPPADEEASMEEEPEVPDTPVEEGWQLFGSNVRGTYADVKEPTLFVPSLTGRYFQLNEMSVSTYQSKGAHYTSGLVTTDKKRGTLQLRVIANPEVSTPLLCIPE